MPCVSFGAVCLNSLHSLWFQTRELYFLPRCKTKCGYYMIFLLLETHTHESSSLTACARTMSYYANIMSIRQKARKKTSGASSLDGVKHGQGEAVGINGVQVCFMLTLSARSTEQKGVAWGWGHLQPPMTLERCPTHQPLTESCTRVTEGLSPPKQTPILHEGAGLPAGQEDGTADGSPAVNSLPSFRVKKKGNLKPS